MNDAIEYIALSQNQKGAWIETHEFLWKLPLEEMAILYAACCTRLSCLQAAESNLTHYRHLEPLRINGKTQIVEIHSGTPFLTLPFFKNKEGAIGSPQGISGAQDIFTNTTQWRSSKDVGLQAIASIGWLMDITKAKPPEINKDTSSTNYTETLLPTNLQIKEEAAPSGYNQNQLKLLKDTQNIAAETLKNCGEVGTSLKSLNITLFGNLVFKTYSRIWGSLPDPEEIERLRFEKMKEQAKAKREEDNE